MQSQNNAVKTRVLVVDDEVSNIDLLTYYLSREGYEVTPAFHGQEALAKTTSQCPDLVLLDSRMPVMDGLTYCEKIRGDFLTRSLPVILLTGYNTLEDRLRALRMGVDDFIHKPFDLVEVKERVECALRRRRWDLSSHPLTHLPGSPSIEEDVRRRLQTGVPFAFSYLDIDNFKAYNDAYGYEAGDRVIKRVAGLLIGAAKAAAEGSAFAGHIGGDDFVFIGDIDPTRGALPPLLERFDADRRDLYNDGDWERGGIETKNRQGQDCFFPLLSLSAAVVSTATRTISHYARLAEIASELKAFVKRQPHQGKSLLLWDRRIDPKP